jgi:hypothetical protein
MDEKSAGIVKDSSEGVWLLIRTSSRALFGRLKDFKELNEDTRKNVRGIIKNKSGLDLDFVLDHYSPLRRVPLLKNGKMQADPNNPTEPLTGIGREEITAGFEFTLEPCVVTLWNIESSSFVDDMGPRDKKHAREGIDAALESINDRRAEAAGIQRVTQMPNDGNGAPHFKLDLR